MGTQAQTGRQFVDGFGHMFIKQQPYPQCQTGIEERKTDERAQSQAGGVRSVPADAAPAEDEAPLPVAPPCAANSPVPYVASGLRPEPSPPPPPLPESPVAGRRLEQQIGKNENLDEYDDESKKDEM